METTIQFEQFGKSIIRFSLPLEYSEQDRTAFLNLFWLQQGERTEGNDRIETFTLTVKQWVSAINTFRIMNTGKIWHEKEIRENYLCLPNRQRNTFVASGMRFVRVEQRPEVGVLPYEHKTGNHDHDNATDNVFFGTRSQLEPNETSD